MILVIGGHCGFSSLQARKRDVATPLHTIINRMPALNTHTGMLVQKSLPKREKTKETTPRTVPIKISVTYNENFAVLWC